MKLNFAKLWPMLVISMGFFLLWLGLGDSWPTGGPLPTLTPEPIVPTRTAVAETAVLPPLTTSPVPTPLAMGTAVPAVPPAANPVTSITAASRFGVTFPEGNWGPEALAAGLKFGSYLNWHADLDLAVPRPYWRMVRVGEVGLTNDTWDDLTALAQTHPSSFWLVGNEMDVKWQDNVTAERYAEIYHDVYTHLKTADPTAIVGIGGVSQPTPLRLAYLDRVLNSYQARYGQPLPTDLWNVHAFILPEQVASWGVDIPPGMDETAGMNYALDEHDNLEIFAQNLVDFRRWMAARGYQDRPLVVSEYGILMPPDYGFDAQRVATFLEGTLDFFTTAADPALGYPADDGRLVQWWFWYAVYDVPERYPAGNLYDPATQRLTAVGDAYSRYPRE